MITDLQLTAFSVYTSIMLAKQWWYQRDPKRADREMRLDISLIGHVWAVRVALWGWEHFVFGRLPFWGCH